MRQRTYTLSLRLFVAGEPVLQQMLLIHATNVRSAVNAFELLFYGQDPLAWAVRCPRLTIREGVSRALLRQHFTSNAIHEFEAWVEGGGRMMFSWEYERN